ncbi:MAG: hypothetical protein HYY06_24835 [Deltaproteobacteria bacterium]|nr:hypothetical protein [Deltaproteobacteria bacterium]
MRYSILALLSFACPACSCDDEGDDTPTEDGGTEDGGSDGVDAGPDGCQDGDGDRRGAGCRLGDDCDDTDPSVWSQDAALRFGAGATGVAAGQTRLVEISLDQRACAPRTITFESDDPSKATVEASVQIDRGEQTAEIVLTGVAEGAATVTASSEGLEAAQIEVEVVSPDLPACSGEASGTLQAGARVAVDDGTLAGAAISLPAAATEITPVGVSIGCAPSQEPEGFVALGPAVRIDPVATRALREIPVEIPLRAALLPTRARPDNVAIAYSGPGVSARIVPLANLSVRGDPDSSTAYFESPRLGTFQAVVREDVNESTRTRRFTFRAIVGVSMGAGGAALIGFRNPEKWDFIGPLGGPTDWQYLLHQIEIYHMGGFCSADQGELGTYCPVPAPTQIYEHSQDFEHWFYEDEYSGQGGTFDRHEYVQIFRDLALGFGNPNSENPDSFVTPAGVPDSERFRSDADRCASPVVFDPDEGQRYYDDQYNPDGEYPVITFCDGNELPDDTGTWDPSQPGYYPMEVALAVDLNGNGVRDAGEPVIRNGNEPYRDTGIDGAFSVDEDGYDAATNPDPAGDDYDFQFNPRGTEGNWDREDTEGYDDIGVDGVAGTPQISEGGYDSGEGNGEFDWTTGARSFREQNPRRRALEMDEDEYARIDFYSDGGIRDLFNFAVVTNHFVSSLIARGPDEVRIYNGFPALYGEPDGSDDEWHSDWPDYTRIGRHAFVRYGSLDASEEEKQRGDGGHVGTVAQILNRLTASAYVASSRWPGGDRQEWDQDVTTDDDCSEGYLCTFDFTDDNGRTGPVSILLPPGYHDERFADTAYPVMYFGHGYGQQPNDLIMLAVVFANYMISPGIAEERRLQKFIMVFPDGRCRGDECLAGTFYTNSVRPEGPQMIDFLESLADFVDESFRTRAPEEVEVRY